MTTLSLKRRCWHAFLLCSILSVSLLPHRSVSADSIAWDWQVGECVSETGWILDEKTLFNDIGTEICVTPPSHMIDAVQTYEGIYIGSAWFGATSDPAPRCAIAAATPTTVRSDTLCTLEPAHFAGNIDFTPKSNLCTTCASCNTKLNDPTLTTVLLAADILETAGNHAGQCISPGLNFTNKTFDCQGFTIDGDAITQANYEAGIILGSGRTGNTVMNCVVTDFRVGIQTSFSPGNTFAGNTLRSNTIGMYIGNQSGNTIIQNNTFEDNETEGLAIRDASNGNVVSGNTALNNATDGFLFSGSGNNDISSNTAAGNSTGFHLVFPSSDTFFGNQALDNSNYGLRIEGSSSVDVESNTFCGNVAYDVHTNAAIWDGVQNKCETAWAFNDLGLSAWGCTFSCVALPVCANGILEPPEECDDGNLDNGDGCRSDCTIEGCGDGIVDPGESCDDGNTVNEDGCSAVCALEACGDGVTQPGLGEECDDGNTVDGDGCDAACLMEPVNTPVGSDVTVTDGSAGVEITFSSVASPGVTTVTAGATGPGLPSGFRLASDPPKYIDVSTTAAYDGSIRLCVVYDEADVLGDEANLTLMHWNGTLWEDITDPPVDTVNNEICGITLALSPFAVMESLTTGVIASIEVNPRTLNLNSKGKWITVYIELPTPLDAAAIDPASVLFAHAVAAALTPAAIGDFDADGIADLMLKFERASALEELVAGDAVSVVVTGSLHDGTPFSGIDTIRVLKLH